MTRTPRRRPSLEALEDRHLPATYGLPWPDPGRLTLSLAPDGTPVGSAPSTLSASLDRLAPPGEWTRVVLRAVQSWVDLGNVNVGLVADDGRAFGAPGPLEGDPGHGDLRVAARPLSDHVLALATPFDLLNTWSGDVVLNADLPFSLGGANDLYTAVLHETGHAFGLGDNPADPDSAMYTVDATPHDRPDAADVALFRSLYGARRPDAYEGASGNDSPGRATALTFVDLAAIAGTLPSLADPATLAGPRGPWVASADLTTPADRDVYAVEAPASGGPLAAVVHASGVSLLTSRVSVLDAAGRVLASAAATDPLANDVTVTLPRTTPGATYYVRVEAAGAEFAVGAYRLAVGLPVVAPLLATPTPSAWGFYSDPNKGTRFETATDLTPQTPGTDARWPYVVRDGLVSPTQTAYYRLQAPPASSAAGTLIATVWGTRPGGLAPTVTVLDARQNPVPVRVLHDGPDSVTVAVDAPEAGATYVLAVSATGPVGGGYVLGATFRAHPIDAAPFAEGTLDAGDTDDFRTLSVHTAALFHFELSGAVAPTAAANAPTAAVRMTLFDSSKHAALTVRAFDGAGPASGDVLLTPGTYVVRVHAATGTEAPLPRFRYRLLGTVRSDPIGPVPADPIYAPTEVTPPPDPYSIALDPDPVYVDYLDLTDIIINPWM